MNLERSQALELLGLQSDYSSEELKKAYHRLSERCHPDVGGTDGLFRLISDARQLLSQPRLLPRCVWTAQSAPRPYAGRREPPPTWEEAICADDFFVPFDDLARLYTGALPSVIVRWHGYPIEIRQQDVRDSWRFIPSKGTAHVSINSWPSKFKMWVGGQEIVRKSDRVDIRNNRQTEKFRLCIRVAVPRGYHEVTVNFHGHREQFRVAMGRKDDVLRSCAVFALDDVPDVQTELEVDFCRASAG